MKHTEHQIVMLDVDLDALLTPPAKGGDRKMTVVTAPAEHHGVSSALKSSYSLPPISEDFARLLAKLR